MCYYVASKLSGQEIFQLEHDFVVKWEEEDPAVFFAVPGFVFPKLPVITADKEFKNLRWGLIPSWVKDGEGLKKLGMNTLNAICETVDTKPSFRVAVKAGRFCVVPVNGFYEWHHHTNGQKYPHYIYPKNSPYFLMAGLYEQWTNRDLNETLETFTILTTAANARMEYIHNTKKRMPVILDTDKAKLWLDQQIAFSQKKDLLVPCDPEMMMDHTVGKLITSRKESPNQPKVLEKVEYTELNEPGQLF